jgi:predicted aspartyl protease
MIVGTVTPDGTPIVLLPVAGKTWQAIIDSGFNGDLELPEALRPAVNPRFTLRVLSILAGGQQVLEDNYDVDFPFDGRTLTAEATFVDGSEILIGTGLMRRYRLEIDFVARTVRLDRVASP